jgi:hypothetical protein
LWDKVRVEGRLTRRCWVATGKYRRAGRAAKNGG